MIQIYFLTILGAFDEATFVALLSSSISVILSVVDIWSAKQIVTIIDNATTTSVNHIEFVIKSNDEIEQCKPVLLTKPRALAKAIAKTLIVDVRTIEIYLLLASHEGIKVGFTIYSLESDLYKIFDDIMEEQTKLQLLIANYWQLKTFPEINNFHRGQRVEDHTLMDGGDDTLGHTTTTANTLHPEGEHFGKTMLPNHIPLSRMNTIKRHKVFAQDPELMTDDGEEYEQSSSDMNVVTPKPPMLRSKSSQWRSFMNNMEKFIKLHKGKSVKACTATPNVVVEENKHWTVYSQNIESLLLQREMLQSKYISKTADKNGIKQHRSTRTEKALDAIFETVVEEQDQMEDDEIENETYLLQKYGKLRKRMSYHQQINSISELQND